MLVPSYHVYINTREEVLVVAGQEGFDNRVAALRLAPVSLVRFAHSVTNSPLGCLSLTGSNPRKFCFPRMSRCTSYFQTGRPGGIRTPNKRFWRPPLYRWSYWPVTRYSLTCFPMHCVPLAPLAVLFVLNTLRVLLLILLGSVVASFALHTRQGNQGTHLSLVSVQKAARHVLMSRCRAA